MQAIRRYVTSAALLGVIACGGEGGSGPSVTYESIAGTFGGNMQGVTQGVSLNADLVLTISQSQGSLSGTWATDGFLTDGVDVVGISGSGTLTGSINSGNNPSVNITIRSSQCQNRQDQFSGTYDSVNRRINLQGSVRILDFSDCSILLTYQMNFIMQL
jgi:hypothetical protein